MALSVVRQSIEVEQMIGEDAAQVQVKAEAMVPGAGRERVSILMEEALLSIGSVEVQADRVVLDGTVACQAVYRLGDESDIHALTAQGTLSHVADLPGAGPRMTAQVQGQVEHTECAYENGHIVFRITVGIRIRVLSLSPMEVIGSLEGLEGLEAQTVDICSLKTSAESTTSVLLRDDVDLPSALDSQQELMHWTGVQLDQVSPDLGGVRASGTVQVDTMIASGVAGRPVALVKYQLPFDQLIEMPEWLSGDVKVDAEVRGVMADVMRDEEDAQLQLEVSLDLIARAMQQDCVSALEDAYATGAQAVAIHSETLELASAIERMSCTDGFKGTLLLPEGAPGVGAVLAVRAHPVLSQWNVQDGHTTLEGVIEATVLYMPGGSDQVTSVRAELPFEIHCQGELPQEAWINLTAVDADATALMSDRLELKCTLKVDSSARMTQSVAVAMMAEETEPESRKSALVIAYPGSSDTFWSIGKKYGLAVSQLQALNPGVPAVEPGRPLLVRVTAV